MSILTMIVDFIKKYAVIVAAVVAFFVGWMLMGWVISPVTYEGGDIAHLHRGYQQEYVRLVAAAYELDQDPDLAVKRLQQLGPKASDVISGTLADPGLTPIEKVRVSQMQVVWEYMEANAPAKPAAQPDLISQLFVPLGVCVGVVILLAIIGGVVFFLIQARAAGTKRPRAAGSPAPQRMTLPEAGSAAAEAAPEGMAPVARFMTTYTLGDDVYDDSFSVDGPDGNFLGECGMGISETIGVGDPKKVTAFEVWLFDKNDIRTVTRVLMSEHAFRDEALKSRLAAKGEPVQAKAGDTVSLETATLTVTARVVDMAYGGGALPPNSYFERLTIELAAYRKPNVTS